MAGVQAEYSYDRTEFSCEYTLSHGISPGVASLQMLPQASPLPEIGSLRLSDGERELVLQDFRLISVASGASASGLTWQVQLEDHRWRWRYGHISGAYNYGLVEGREPEAGTDEWYARRRAPDLAALLLEAMDEGSYDASALPYDAYPEVDWDWANPAKELAELCDRYGLLICWSPVTGQISLREKGTGDSLPEGLPYTSLDLPMAQARRPYKLIGLTGPAEHEQWLELEAVALDTDGTIKPFADLSYGTGGDFGGDYISYRTLATDAQREAATKSAFRWYRIKGGQDVDGWKDGVSLEDMLPISAELVTTEIVKASDGTEQLRRKRAYVKGSTAASSTDTDNTDADTEQHEGFSIDEKTGIVKFSRPQKVNDDDDEEDVRILEASLQLRCVVFGDRLAVEEIVGGPYGDEIVPCSGLALQYIDGAVQNLQETYGRVNEILAGVKAGYDSGGAGAAEYVGIHDLGLDGAIQQVSWEAGPSGAFTRASVNCEHDVTVPSAPARRRAERAARRVLAEPIEPREKAATGEPPALVHEPRWLIAQNGYAGAVPAFSLVRTTAIGATGIVTVNRPSSDSSLSVGVSGAGAIDQNGAGLVSFDWPLPVVYAGGAPSVGDEMGTATDSFELTAGKTGFLVVGVNATAGLAWIVPKGGGAPVVAVTNASGLSIPARSFVEVTGFAVATGIATVTRPTVPNLEQVLVTGASAIGIGASGQASWVTPCVAAYDTGGDAPAAGLPIGTQADSFEGLVGNAGFVCLGAGSAGTVGIARVNVFSIWYDDGE